MKGLLHRNGRPRTTRVLCAVPVSLLLLAACDPNAIPFGAVRVQGAFDNLVPAETIIEARAARPGGRGGIGLLNPRSLISQSASISAILAGVNEEDFEDPGVVTTTEVTEEGGFSVDVPTAAAPDGGSGDYVMLAYDEALGVGVEQLIGFIELPAGADESSAGWPLGGTAQGTTVDLGTMGGDGGAEQSIVAASDQNELYEALGADQAAVLQQAYRDDYLKISQNRFLNQSDGVYFDFNHRFWALRDNAYNAWSSVSDGLAAPESGINLRLLLDRDGTYLLDEIRSGQTVARLFPPAEITYDASERGRLDPDPPPFSPDNPLVLLEDQSVVRFDGPFEGGFGGKIEVNLRGPFPEGTWTLTMNEELVGAYDFGVTNPLQPDGTFTYFLPSIRLSVEGDPAQITEAGVRFYLRDPATESYDTLQSGLTQLPLDTDFRFALAVDTSDPTVDKITLGERFVMSSVTGDLQPLPEPIYLDRNDGDPYLMWVAVDVYMPSIYYGFGFENQSFFDNTFN